MATDGSVTYTEQTSFSMKLVKCVWTAGNDGGVSGFFTVNAFDGEVSLCTVIPSAVNVPTVYTVSVLDNNGLDLLIGSGTARSATLTQTLTKPGGAVSMSKLQLVVTGAGAGGQGILYIFIR
jgi:hypothetical protein